MRRMIVLLRLKKKPIKTRCKESVTARRFTLRTVLSIRAADQRMFAASVCSRIDSAIHFSVTLISENIVECAAKSSPSDV